jgi:hypothetical protein
MSKPKYYRDGIEIDAARALDHRGILRSGCTMRIPMTMRDALSPLQRSVADTTAHRARVTDGTDNPFGLHKPGFRIRTGDTSRQVVADAYAKADRQMSNAFKVRDGQIQCPDCDGEGDIDGDECETCHGSGVVSDGKSKKFDSGNEGRRNEDSRSVTRDQAYADYDQALSSAWQNGRTG